MTPHEWIVVSFTTVLAVGTWLGAYFANRSANRAKAIQTTTQQVVAQAASELRRLTELGGSIRDEHVAKIYDHVRIVKAVAEQTGNAVLAQQAEELLKQEKVKVAT